MRWEIYSIPIWTLVLFMPIEIQNFIEEILSWLQYQTVILSLFCAIRVREHTLIAIHKWPKLHSSAMFDDRIRPGCQIKFNILGVVDADLM